MQQQFLSLKSELEAKHIILVAVSKTQPPEAVLQLYQQGQRIFGENKVQELLEKREHLPSDIQWHLIGHLQTNKVRQVIPAVAMIESVDSVKLLQRLQKEAARASIKIDILLQVKISQEATKYGFDPESIMEELKQADVPRMTHLRIRGVMGMASFVTDQAQIRGEFQLLRKVFNELKDRLFRDYSDFDQISMGMSGDYQIAIEEGSTMVRLGSLLFGERH